jgi:ABC-2 type transport system permease protein
VRSLTGTGAMVRLALRRDRIRLAVWVLGIAGLALSSLASVTSLYDGPSERESYAAAVTGNPVAVVTGGTGAGLPSMGGVVVVELAIVLSVAVGLMSVLLVVRHTRGEEEAGRTELLRAGVVGRHAGLAASLVVVAAADVAVGALLLAGLLGYGLPVPGSVALAAAVTAFGLVMAGAGAVAAQVTEHARGAAGAAAAALGVFFVVRAAGDLGGGELSWVSPMGWVLEVRPYAGERWWVLLLPLVLAALLVPVAAALVDRRDVGAGLVAARPGPARASRRFRGALPLALRQHRAALLGWAVGLLLMGISYGSVGGDVQDLVSQNEGLRDFFPGGADDLVDGFFATAASLTALVASGFALQVATRLRSEEESGRLEPLLATALTRRRWALSHVAVALVGTALVLGLAGLGMGVVHAVLTDDASQVGRLAGAVLAQTPAIWVLVGVATALFGALPRAVPAAWAVLVAAVVALLLEATLGLPDWLVALSPFEHVPQVPLEDASALPLLLLTAVAAGLVAIGLVSLERRDVT